VYACVRLCSPTPARGWHGNRDRPTGGTEVTGGDAGPGGGASEREGGGSGVCVCVCVLYDDELVATSMKEGKLFYLLFVPQISSTSLRAGRVYLPTTLHHPRQQQ